jgi:hypothetical protein
MDDALPVAGPVGHNADDGPDDLQAFMNRLLEAPFSGKAGNKSLREALGWAGLPDRYWQAHGRALDQGFIITGRGKGGSVQIVEPPKDASVSAQVAQAETEPEAKAAQKETDLYEPARKVINESWVKAENYDDYIVSVTGLRGRAYTGGKWTRPDISLLAVKAYPYLPQRYFDIVTFEVKPTGQTTVEGIFEALSHQQFAVRYTRLHSIPRA